MSAFPDLPKVPERPLVLDDGTITPNALAFMGEATKWIGTHFNDLANTIPVELQLPFTIRFIIRLTLAAATVSTDEGKPQVGKEEARERFNAILGALVSTGFREELLPDQVGIIAMGQIDAGQEPQKH